MLRLLRQTKLPQLPEFVRLTFGRFYFGDCRNARGYKQVGVSITDRQTPSCCAAGILHTELDFYLARRIPAERRLEFEDGPYGATGSRSDGDASGAVVIEHLREFDGRQGILGDDRT